MKKMFYLTLILCPLLSHAADLGPEPKFLVKSVDGTDVSELAAPNVKILPAHRKVANASSLPTIEDRNRIFSESGLGGQIEEWDDFEKDSLYIKLSKKGPRAIDRILGKHPGLKRASLEAAQRLIEKEEQP